MTTPPPPRYPIVLVDATPEDSDALVGQLTLLGAEGIEERDATTLTRGGALGVTLVASFATREEAEQAARAIGPAARVDEIVGDAWRDAWKEHWAPTRLGSRLVVVPSWVEYAPEPGDLVMRLDPGRAFGTGQHASTALCAAALESLVAAAPAGSTVIDLGCGSGILSFAAVMFGAARAIGCDTDPDAVAAARENAAALGLADRTEFRVGGAAAVPETAPLVVANIEAAVLVPIAREVAARVAPGGALVLSGILAAQLDEVVAAYAAAGLAPAGHDAREGWVAPRFVRSGRA